MRPPQINFVTARADSLLLACDPGPCGGCGAMHSFFVCREGKSLCVECDRREQDAGGRKQEAATA